jgi:hypothetical protein
MSIEKHGQYLEGQWAGKKMVENIESTTYGSLENAIIAKQELITQFEEQFGFSRDMENIDSNYAFNLGILDLLKENYSD